MTGANGEIEMFVRMQAREFEIFECSHTRLLSSDEKHVVDIRSWSLL